MRSLWQTNNKLQAAQSVLYHLAPCKRRSEAGRQVVQHEISGAAGNRDIGSTLASGMDTLDALTKHAHILAPEIV